tara:strand:- start:491 stop:2275 length:1785 start_codon:yes stop_codon:yes gene_type:complete
MKIVKKLLFLLSPRERVNFIYLIIMIIIMALLDAIGVASILPFISVLTNPDLIETNIVLKNLFKFSTKFGVENNQEFIFSLGLLVFLLLIISLSFKTLTTYFQVRFVQMREFTIGERLIEGYLNQPYSWFLSRNSSDLGKIILSEVQQIINNGIQPFMEVIAKGMVAIAIIVLLIIADPKLAIIVGFSITGTYFLIFYFFKQFVDKIGQKRLLNNQLRFNTINEAFGAAKEVKVGGLEKIYIKSFAKSAQIFARTQANAQVISLLPRFILEAVAFGGILLIILYFISQTGSFNSALPIISLYAFAGYRLMPAFQQIYASITQINFISSSLDKMYDDLKSLKPFKIIQEEEALSFNQNISLKNIYYNYPNSSRTALKDINLIIPAKSTVGFVGPTGSGKTTIVDIILGLLESQKGSLEVDGKVINKKNSRSWQRSLGYVPQHIFLSDDTISSNIAFGIEPKDVNQNLVEKASKIANLHNFVVDELPKKYETIIGERGIRLSGGQRQRIGIARALYNNPKVLILDEATSALDNQTEQAVMDAVNNLSKDITIILIAHRLNTVKNCDIIFKLDKGKYIGQGTYDELMYGNSNFNKKS